MPSIRFEGREHVHAHHLSVPHRSLVYDKSRSMGKQDDENLIVHGDNLEALKALLPRYGGRVKCIYIDPPYNTGNDNWVYSDNVNSPTMQRWLKSNSKVDGEDMERHDKWLCMMWPRLQLLKELLSNDGVIFISIGNDEQHHLRMMMDEIFGEENRIGIISRLMKSGSNKGDFFSPNIDYVLVYSKDIHLVDFFRIPLEEDYLKKIYTLTATDGARKGEQYREMGLYQASLEIRKNQRYWIECPDGSLAIPPGTTFPGKLLEGGQVQPEKGDGVWRWIYKRYEQELQSENIIFKKTNTSSLIDENSKKSNWNVYSKIWAKDRISEGRVPTDLITKYENRRSAAELKELDISFSYAKPSKLISHLLSFFKEKDFTVLDSFAGSGTTAHAVLALNKEDGGNREFILVECEDYANSITAERVRRVIHGVPDSKNFKEPLGGSFAYYELGSTIGVEEMLTGNSLPSYPDLAAYLLYTASGITVGKELKKRKNWLFHSTDTTDYYLIYEPDAKFLEGNEAILNETMINKISKKGRETTVFAADAYVAQKELSKKRITLCRLPYGIHGGE